MPSTLKPKQPKPTAAHRRLEVFIGDWHAEGTSYGDGQDAADPRASSVPWTSDESYEWLPGSFFVLHRWDAQMGQHEFKGAEIMGYDDAEGGYFTRMFDNAGHHFDYRASVDGDVWRFTEAPDACHCDVAGRRRQDEFQLGMEERRQKVVAFVRSGRCANAAGGAAMSPRLGQPLAAPAPRVSRRRSGAVGRPSWAASHSSAQRRMYVKN